MGKTIEERAKEYAGTALPTSKVRELRVIDYTQGATDQKDIDDKVAFEERDKSFNAGYDTAIEEAVKWLKRRFDFDGEEHNIHVFFRDCIDDFKQAMKK